MKKLIATFAVLLLSTSLFCENITFQAEKMTGSTSNSNTFTCLEGSAKVTSDTLVITADKIELYGKDFRYIKATGKVSGNNSEAMISFTCNSMTYDRETKIATLQDQVNLEDLQNDFKASAQIIEYNQEAQIAIMQIEVSMNQKDNTCKCAFAIYKQKDQTLEMSGNPEITQGTDTFRAQNISLNLETQEITLSGRVKGSVQTNTPKSTEPVSLESESSTKEEEHNTAQVPDETGENLENSANANESQDSAKNKSNSKKSKSNKKGE